MMLQKNSKSDSNRFQPKDLFMKADRTAEDD